MTTLLLIRHGQANFGGDDYDQLSARGEHQASLLGAHLKREGRVVTRSVSGTLRRQITTARLTLAELGNDGTTIDPAFDEYPADALFQSYMPLLQHDDAIIAAAIETGGHAALRADRRLFQRALAGVMGHWVRGSTGHLDVLLWQDFIQRIADGLNRIRSTARREDTIAIFTSGGVIAAAIGLACGMDDDATMALSWRILNSSVSELATGRDGFAMAGFNMVSHLRLAGDPQLLTWR